MPYEDRCEAIIANLGNGLSPQEHMDKAKMALATAAIPNTWYTDISLNTRGTAAFIHFKEPGHLRLA